MQQKPSVFQMGLHNSLKHLMGKIDWAQ